MEALQRLHNRGSISTGYDVDNSCKFDDGNNTTTVEFFERTVSSAGSRTTGTFSAWVKKTELTNAQYLFTFGNTDNDNGRTFARFQTDGSLRIGGGTSVWRNTDRLFVDTAAWYHIVVAFDTTQSTANDRIKIYVNGVQETSFSTTNNPSQNGVLGLNFEKQVIGYNSIDSNSGFTGYMCEIVIQDGVASAATEFGEFDSTTGIWIPKDASEATMGTNGTYLKFENAGSMGAATAGNNFTVQNINQNDQATDTCTNNFCIGNNLVRFTNPSNQVVKQGATLMEKGANGYETISGTIYVTRGKWYCEAQSILNSSTTAHIGVMPDDSPIISAGGAISNFPGSQSGDGGVSYYANNGNKYLDGGNSSYGDSWTSGSGLGDIMGIALDMDNGKVYFAKANTWQNSGDPTSGSTGTGAIDLPSPTKAYTMCCDIYANNNSIAINYGGFTFSTISSAETDANGYGSFEYAPPSGYYALCTKNLEEYG